MCWPFISYPVPNETRKDKKTVSTSVQPSGTRHKTRKVVKTLLSWTGLSLVSKTFKRPSSKIVVRRLLLWKVTFVRIGLLFIVCKILFHEERKTYPFPFFIVWFWSLASTVNNLKWRNTSKRFKRSVQTARA